MFKTILLSIVLVVQTGLVQAQEVAVEDRDRQYVTDQLRLSLYARADSSSQILKYLSSGDLLLIEELSGPYALVTAPDETKGWVKRGFLVSSPTSNLQLEEEQVKVENLKLELNKLSNSKVIIDQYEKDMNGLVTKMEVLENENQLATESIAKLQQEMSDREHELELKKENKLPVWIALWEILQTFWKVIVPIILGIILLSFLVSKTIVETRIKSKFHGIKIW